DHSNQNNNANWRTPTTITGLLTTCFVARNNRIWRRRRKLIRAMTPPEIKLANANAVQYPSSNGLRWRAGAAKEAAPGRFQLFIVLPQTASTSASNIRRNR